MNSQSLQDNPIHVSLEDTVLERLAPFTAHALHLRLMDGSRPGETGVIAWCNSIRFAMAKDSGRQFLYEQIQTEGFDFLDIYLENFLEGPRKECVP